MNGATTLRSYRKHEYFLAYDELDAPFMVHCAPKQQVISTYDMFLKLDHGKYKTQSRLSSYQVIGVLALGFSIYFKA